MDHGDLLQFWPERALRWLGFWRVPNLRFVHRRIGWPDPGVGRATERRHRDLGRADEECPGASRPMTGGWGVDLCDGRGVWREPRHWPLHCAGLCRSSGAAVSICARGAETLSRRRAALGARWRVRSGGGRGDPRLHLRETSEALGGIDILVNDASGWGMVDDEAAGRPAWRWT